MRRQHSVQGRGFLVGVWLLMLLAGLVLVGGDLGGSEDGSAYPATPGALASLSHVSPPTEGVLAKSQEAAAAAVAKGDPDVHLLRALGSMPEVGSSFADATTLAGGDPVTYFVGLEAGAELSSAQLESLGLEQIRVFPQTGTVALAPTAEMPSDPRGIVEELSGMPGVRWAEQGRPRSVARIPNDEHYSRQWGPPAIGLPEAWDTSVGDESVVIAVLDSGVARDIKDLADRIVLPYSTKYETSASWAWEDITGHGSGVAAIAAARGDNSVGMAGTAWDVALMPVHFTDGGTVGELDYVEAIYYAVDHGADVINISYGSDYPLGAEREAVEYALGRGVVVVAAVGNGGNGAGIQYPAAVPGVIAVGAVDQANQLAWFSSTGKGIDVVAPGEDILTYDAGESWYGISEDRRGTSFAAPFVSGLAALMLSVAPELRPAEVERIIKETATDLGPSGPDTLYGSGLVDAEAAVDAALSIAMRTFSDVSADHKYAYAIEELARLGIVNGRANGTFGPDDPVLRAQFAKMICGALHLPVDASRESPFRDLGVDDPLDLYPHQYVATAADHGITVGVAPGLFAPWVSISRAQVVTMTVRAAEMVAPGSLEVPPADFAGSLGMFDPEHGATMRVAEHNGLLDGLVDYGTGWDPWTPATRGEVADVLWRLLLI